VPVRKVSNRGGNIIGRFPSLKLDRMVDFESLIERDFIFLLDFDPQVEAFSEQPLTIEYEADGQQWRYTPDFHIIRNGRYILVECKPEKLVQLPKNQRKIAAGQAWCAAKGWTYQLVTDTQLRRGYRLPNIKLLTQFARYPLHPEIRNRIMGHLLLTEPAPVTVAELMAKVAPGQPQAVQIPIYHLAFHHELLLPIDEGPISLDSPVRLAEEVTS
jgi:hypothetical protein